MEIPPVSRSANTVHEAGLADLLTAARVANDIISPPIRAALAARLGV
ncbi:MAG: hypothetical protein H6871_04635 [Methylobacteriaceae bacterium]|nr:hypothetical protein [Methylobacteriaceae bacterium]